MPRSKNPNPRQVTDGEVNGYLDNSQGQESPTGNNDELVISQPKTENALKTEQNGPGELSPPLHTEDWSLSAVIPPTDGDEDAYFTPPTAISALQFASLPSDCAEEHSADPQSDVTTKQVSLYSRSNDSKKSKAHLANVFNPQVMTWMRNRFEMGTGGKISASDISNLYRKDTEHMENPPPGLQNYQVGQLLRRVFPEITRCKITVDGRRYWVYKHLTLIKNPPENLFEERAANSLNFTEIGMECDLPRFDGIGTSGSPSSIGDEPYANAEDSDNDVAKAGMLDPKFASDKDKHNALLLGLLGRDRPTTSPIEDTVSFHNGIGMGKKKRDSEVIDWLRTSYKYKAGYYVKSMDLLRKYNNGRVEIVKYLSQVGRVMKHVFPEVRHLRKSFKGGKREWVYLNLKPVDVDSDSEEGKSMVMPTMRRATGWYQGQDSFDLPKSSPGWKRERVDISHAPLSLVRPESVFSRRNEVFQAKRYPNDNKVVIKKAYDDVPSLLHWAKQQCFGNDVDITTELASSENEDSNGAKIREITHTPDIDKMKETNDIERDIFAPFAQLETANNDCQMEAKRLKLSRLHSSKTTLNASNTSTRGISASKTTLLTLPSNVVISQPRQINVPSESNSPALDLTVKGSTNDASSFREKLDQILSIPGSPVDGTAMDTQDASLPNKPASYGATSSSVILPGRGNNPTIHYHPPHITRSGPGYTQGNTESVNSATSGSQQYHGANSTNEENLISWLALQAFNAQPYGWMKSPIVPRYGDAKESKQSRFLEWFSFCGQSLVNKQRALKEVKIYEDWTVEIYALGRRVFPNDLGGITDLEKTTESLTKVFRVLAEAKICTGFPAPSVNDLYIHGVLVSRCEVWSSRDSPTEDLRQRAVNCQMMYSSSDPCCSKCTRIMMLHQQPGKTFLPGNKNNTDNSNIDGRIKSERI